MQRLTGLAGILQQYRELGEQQTRLQTQITILSQQNAAALEKAVDRYGEEVHTTTLEQLEEYSVSIEADFGTRQAKLNAVLQEIRVSVCGLGACWYGSLILILQVLLPWAKSGGLPT